MHYYHAHLPSPPNPFQPLIYRDFRGDVDIGEVDKFLTIVNDNEDEGTGTPIISTGGTTFTYIKHQNVYLVCATKKNANIMMMFVFLHKLVEVQ